MNRVLSAEERANGLQGLQKEAQPKRRRRHDRLFDAMMVLIALIALLLCLGLFIRYVSRGPRVVRKETVSPTVDLGTRPRTPTTTAAAATTTVTPATEATAEHEGSGPQDDESTAEATTAMPSQRPLPKPGTERYAGDLPGDVEPKHYDVTIALTGENLAYQAMKVTGRAETSLEVLNSTSKLILKSKASTINLVGISVLEVPAASGDELMEVNITTLSKSDPFLIAALETPLEAGKSYTLVTEYDYDKRVKSGPIYLSAEVAKMELKKREAHAAFPCFERTGWNVPVALTLQIPKGHLAVANAALDGQPEVTGSMITIKFKDTLAMPLDMLAWVVFPASLKRTNVLPGKIAIYAQNKNAALTASAKNAFEFLPKYFQDPAKELITKIDLVFPKASKTQESLGFIVLEETTTPEGMCAKIANQWTRILMSQPTGPTWLGSAGVSYLCRLAVTEEHNLPAAFLGDLKECKETNPTPGTRDLLVFRMAHFILGDAATQKALQNYVAVRVFSSTTTDEELSAFGPDVSKELLVAWRKEPYQTNELARTLGNTKIITWKNGRDPPTPFAQTTDNNGIELRAPSAVAVTWLNKSKADMTTSIGDTMPVYVNPSMMACYGIQLDSKWWSLIGKDMERNQPGAINAWYLLGEAAKQYKGVVRPHDFTGYMWMWAALKYGDEDLWSEHAVQFVKTERQAYSMVTTEEEERKYKARIVDLVHARIGAMTLANIANSYNDKTTTTLLLDMACEISMEDCGRVIVANFGEDPTFYTSKKFKPEPMSPEALACYVGSQVKTTDDFAATIKLKSMGMEARLSLRLTFCGCVPSAVAQQLDAKINEVYDEVLHNAWTSSAAAAIRVPRGLRERVLWILKNAAQATVNSCKATLISAQALHLIRTRVEFKAVKEAAEATPNLAGIKFHGIEDMLVPDDAPLHDWIRN
ncbi:uncharacterized protein [Dermacentor andersoni]|uniref:uncharacterized protein isoform X1 n=1 Tax=Dermacentor andersoni TaxID=34620 RepID=UPI0024162738|nr:uncharacterized protein LOC126526230 isoform X1 [Dermacentor andersoni]XP_054924083.1 uncharacterized protein LOC126526230 isoform X1 [Dermacentor andersoni]